MLHLAPTQISLLKSLWVFYVNHEAELQDNAKLVFIFITGILLRRFNRSQRALGVCICVKGLRRGEIFVFVFIFGEDRRNEIETTKSTISAKCDE